ncbi:MAG: aspartyl/asparaginyl beta-hydroxylase domain-containing protein [Candidatus Margulisiibacteriota bacterium]
MKNFRLIQKGLNLAHIYNEVMANENLFVEIPRTIKPWQPGYQHMGLQMINMRVNNVPSDVMDNPESYKRFSDDLFCHDLEAYKLFPETRKLIYALLESVGGSHIGRLAAVRLMPGESIYGHYDTGLSAEYFSRYHIIIEGTNDNWAHCGEKDGIEEWLEMKTGEIWSFNHKLWHGFDNRSDKPRMYINVDIA